jgi:hypothetical protein
VVELLLARGADRALRDNGGRTAADLASITTLRQRLAPG